MNKKILIIGAITLVLVICGGYILISIRGISGSPKGDGGEPGASAVDGTKGVVQTDDSGASEEQFGYIGKVYEKNNKRYLDVDYVEFLGGDMTKIKNDSPQIKSLEISPQAEFTMQTFSRKEDGSSNLNEKISYDKFKRLFPQNSPFVNVIFRIVTEDGIILGVAEQYTP